MADEGAPFLPLDERARTLFHLQSLGSLVWAWGPVSVGLAVAVTFLSSVRDGLIVGGGWFALQTLIALWWPMLAFPRWGWRLDAETFSIRRGVLFRTVVSIPRSRIQHVDVRQGPFEQLVGLARIQVHTASGLGPDGSLPGLTPADAERLRLELVAGGGSRAHDGV